MFGPVLPLSTTTTIFIVEDERLSVQVNRSERPSTRRVGVLVGLSAAALACSLLAVVQWMELIRAQDGGASFCAMGEHMNCLTVWESGFAKNIHRWTRIPIAGWGLVFGLTAFGASILEWISAVRGADFLQSWRMVRLTGVIGVIVSICLFGVSVGMGTVCPTCLGTYALTILYAVLAFRTPRGGPSQVGLKRSLLALGGVAAASYLLLLYPGASTPVEGSLVSELLQRRATRASRGAAVQRERGKAALRAFLATLPTASQQDLSDRLDAFKNAAPRQAVAWPSRNRSGAASAPVQLVVFSDIRCLHCRQLHETLNAIERSLPPGAFAIENRHFPRDASCNPEVAIADESETSCLAAKALLCLEGQDGYAGALERMFTEQRELSEMRIREIAEAAGLDSSTLGACIDAPDTISKLRDDIAYAMAYAIEVTPLVLMNGKPVVNDAALLYALILAKGDANHEAFRGLPSARSAATK